MASHPNTGSIDVAEQSRRRRAVSTLSDRRRAAVSQVRAVDDGAGMRRAAGERRDQHLLSPTRRTKSALSQRAARKGGRRGIAHRAVHPPDRAAAVVRGAAAARRGRRRRAARIEFLKLLRQVPEVTDIAQIDAAGREQIAVVASRRWTWWAASATARRSRHSKARAAGRPWFGPVYFRKETEPYMTIAVRAGGDNGPRDRGRGEPQVHLGRRSRASSIGDKGKAYVVDGNGFLVADPGHRPGAAQDRPLRSCRHVKAATRAASVGESARLATDVVGQRGADRIRPDRSAGLEGVRRAAGSGGLRHAQRLDPAHRADPARARGVAWSRVWRSPAAWCVRSRTLQEGARRIGAGDLDQKIVVRHRRRARGARRPVQPHDGASCANRMPAWSARSRAHAASSRIRSNSRRRSARSCA